MHHHVLYLFQSARLIILEIKHLGLPDTTPAAQLYQWLHYVPASRQLTRLQFVAMHSAPPFETREFTQGSLRFSAIEGVFSPAGTTEALAMRREFLMELPPELTEQLQHL